MLEDISNKLKDTIQGGMKEKFGLSDTESEQSLTIMLERIKNFFSEDSIKGNLDSLKKNIQDITSEGGSLKEKFNKETVNELINKVGLSEDVANKVKDFSIETYFNQFKSSFAGLEDRIDISGILDKINPDNFEENAKELRENFNKIFNKK